MLHARLPLITVDMVGKKSKLKKKKALQQAQKISTVKHKSLEQLLMDDVRAGACNTIGLAVVLCE